MRRLVEAWDRFWFSPQSPLDLGVARVLLFGGIFWWRWRADPSAWAEIGAPFWFPIRLFSILDLPLLSAPALEALQLVWIVAVGLAAIGLMTRVSTVVAFVLGVGEQTGGGFDCSHGRDHRLYERVHRRVGQHLTEPGGVAGQLRRRRRQPVQPRQQAD